MSNYDNFFLRSKHITWLNNKEFTLFLWKFFKKILVSGFGLVTDNLSKSVIYWSLKTLDVLISNKCSLSSKKNLFKKNKLSLSTTKYIEPISILPFSFQNKIYNSLMLSFLFMFVNNYLSIRVNFRLYYSFLIYNSNFLFYNFVNLYYFKIKQL
jgi:hypothetical protein